MGKDKIETAIHYTKGLEIMSYLSNVLLSNVEHSNYCNKIKLSRNLIISSHITHRGNMFCYTGCRCSWAVVAPVKYECDWVDLKDTFTKTEIYRSGRLSRYGALVIPTPDQSTEWCASCRRLTRIYTHLGCCFISAFKTEHKQVWFSEGARVTITYARHAS